MIFSQMVSDICGRLNLVSAEAIARVGQELNDHYRQVTATIGLEPLRYVTRSMATTLTSDTVTFSGIEKIDRVFEKDAAGNVSVLKPVMLAELRQSPARDGNRHEYAVLHQTADSITIQLPGQALAVTTLYADGWSTLADMTGSDRPAIPESFHVSILVNAVIGDEYLRKEKTDLADRFYGMAEAALKELRFTLADAPAIDWRQGDQVIGSEGGGNTGGSGSSTITGTITFAPTPPAPPFVVLPGSGLVQNLNADLFDGQHGAFYQDGANLQNDSVSFAKLPNLAAARLLGRNAATPGDPEPITVGTGLVMSGTTLAATGGVLPPGAHAPSHQDGGSDELNVTGLSGLLADKQSPLAHAASHQAGGADPLTALDAAILTGTLPPARIADDSITYAKLPNVTAQKLLGRGDSGAGDPQEITLGANLTIVGTQLNAAGGAGAVPGGATTQVQFNDSGAFGGDAGLVYDKTTDTLTVVGAVALGATPDVVILRDGVGIAALKNGAIPQTLRVYGTPTKYSDIQHNGTHLSIINTGGGSIQLAPQGSGVISCFSTLIGVPDNTVDVGNTLNRFRNVNVATALIIGTNPASSGDLRLANAARVRARNAANTADIQVAGTDNVNNVVVGDQGGTSNLELHGGTSITLRPALSSANDIKVAANQVYPQTDAAVNLGGAANRWKDGYFSGTVNAAGHTFPATAVPSANVNTLDDYREGSWTPALTGVTGGAGQVYTVQSGFYTKVGRLVTVHGSITLANYGSMSGGSMVITGLPFQSASPTAVVPIGYWENLTAAIVGMSGFISPGGTTVNLWFMPPAGVASTNSQPFPTGYLNHTSAFAFVFSYLANG